MTRNTFYSLTAAMVLAGLTVSIVGSAYKLKPELIVALSAFPFAIALWSGVVFFLIRHRNQSLDAFETRAPSTRPIPAGDSDRALLNAIAVAALTLCACIYYLYLGIAQYLGGQPETATHALECAEAAALLLAFTSLLVWHQNAKIAADPSWALATSYSPLTLWADDLLAIEDALAGCDTFLIDCAGNAYRSSSDFLLAHPEQRYTAAQIETSGPGLLLDLGLKHASMRANSAHARNSALYQRIDTILSGCERRPRVIYLVPALIAILALSTSGAGTGVVQTLAQWAWPLGLLITVQRHDKSYSRINCLFKKDDPSFLRTQTRRLRHVMQNRWPGLSRKPRSPASLPGRYARLTMQYAPFVSCLVWTVFIAHRHAHYTPDTLDLAASIAVPTLFTFLGYCIVQRQFIAAYSGWKQEGKRIAWRFVMLATGTGASAGLLLYALGEQSLLLPVLLSGLVTGIVLAATIDTPKPAR